MSTEIEIIHGALARLERIVNTRLIRLPHISDHIENIKQTLRAKLVNGTLQSYEVTIDSIAYRCRLLESEALEVYEYLKGLELI